MARAIACAADARRRSAPNPWVGCVVVNDGVVVGIGATEPPGGPHAERVALSAAGARAAGATAYVTLEPCSHEGRTSPCAAALVAAGVARVVIAIEDPDPRVAGEGIAQLRAAGIDVVLGVGAEAARRSLMPYLHQRRTGRPWCLVKTAMSLDGRTAAADGSQGSNTGWITGEAARADAHELRADSQAIVVGAGTAIADRPALTVRDVSNLPVCPPLRVVLDGRGRVAPEGPLFDTELAPTLVVTTSSAPPSAVDAWHAAGAKVEVLAAAGNGARSNGVGVDLRALLDLLGGLGVLQAMFEGGATVHGALLAENLIDHLVLYMAPVVLGADALGAFALPEPIGSGPQPDHRPDRQAEYRLVDHRQLGVDLRIDYERVDASEQVA